MALAEQAVGRRIPIARNLHGERSARSDVREQFREQRSMIRQPLESRIREHDVVLFAVGGSPVADTARDPLVPRLSYSRGLDHFIRVVQAGDVRLGPPSGEHLGAVAWTATEVNHTPW